MHTVLSSLTLDRLLTIVTIPVSATIGWIITYIYFKKSRQIKSLCFAVQTRRLYAHGWDSTPDFEVSFHGKPVLDPRRATLFIWNPREITINRQDVSTVDPLRFGDEDLSILWVGVVLATRSAVNAQVRVASDKANVALDFDFLDEDDGIAVDVVYDVAVKGRQKKQPTLRGSIKGIHGGPKRVGIITRKTKFVWQLIGFVIVTITFGSAILLVLNAIIEGGSLVFIITKLMGAALLGFVSLIATLITLTELGASWKPIIPSGLAHLTKQGFTSIEDEGVLERLRQAGFED